MKKGFTLVELSIVLVIIGLLIGGILVAQSMISTAKIQSAVRQVQQLDAAINNFQTKYNSLPGDSKIFGGDGDGSIGPRENINYAGEISNVWTNLQVSGFNYQNKTFANTLPGSGFTTTGDTPNSPSFILGNNVGIIIAESTDEQFTGGDYSLNAYNFANWEGLTAGNFIQGKPFISPADALAFDSKIDDGNPAMGNVQNRMFFVSGSDLNVVRYCDDYLDVGQAAAKYLTDRSVTDCFLSIGIQGLVLDIPNSA